MHEILIAGAGKIGSIIAHILASSGEYKVYLGDLDVDDIHNKIEDSVRDNIEAVHLDVMDEELFKQFVKQHPIQAVMSCLPHQCNQSIVNLAKDCNIDYFDLTEDVRSSELVDKLSKNSKNRFVPQCGLAPGLIDIIANDLIQKFTEVNEVKLRCGALPVTASNPLQYSLTWSTDGLINEYGNFCQAIQNYEEVMVPPLSDLESIQIDGLSYEAFNTSGGLGSLAETYAGKIKNMNYKSVRYPGHCEKMHFLMFGLDLNEDRKTLKHIMENALPGTEQDVVLVFVSVNGSKDGRFMKEAYVKKFYPRDINGKHCAAIQLTTAVSACIIIDIVLNNTKDYQGRVHQERFTLEQMLANRFGEFLS